MRGGGSQKGLEGLPATDTHIIKKKKRKNPPPAPRNPRSLCSPTESSRVPETKGLNRCSQLRDLLFQFVHLSAWTFFLLLAGLPLPVERVGSRLVHRDVSPGCYSWWGFAKTGLFFPGTGVLLRVKVISRETNCRGIDFWPHE